MERRSKKDKYHIFGIRQKAGIAVALTVFVTAVILFVVAVYFHFTMTMENVVDQDIYSISMIASELDPYEVADILAKGQEIYYSIPEEVREDKHSKEYRSYFNTLKDDEYYDLKNQLISYAQFEDLKWLDLRFWDEEHGRYVFLIDTEVRDDAKYDAGYWEYDTGEIPVFFGAIGDYDGDMKKDTMSPLEVLFSLRYYGDLSRFERFSVITEFFDPDTGESLGYIGAGERFIDYRESIAMYMKITLIVLFFILIVVYLLVNLLINHWLVRPLKKLASAASDFVDEEDKTKDKGYFEQVNIPTHDELLLLRNSMVDMEKDLVRYVNDISTMTAEKERVAVEMDMSARIQLSQLPQKLENYVGENSFEISSLIQPAKDVGGDFYDYYVIDDDHIAITIADVSGKGVPAALFMMSVKTLLRMAGKMYESPAEITRTVNNQLYEQNAEMLFVTVFFGIYTISEKKLVYVNAGHEDLALYRNSNGYFENIKEDHDLVMAIMPDAEFIERTLSFSSGDRLYLYTDGVTEAINPQGEMFGEDRMADTLNSIKDLSGNEFLSKMRECISSFVKEAPQFDDITMLLLEIK